MEKLTGLKKIKTAVFISGTGSNLNSLIKFSKTKKSPISIDLIISNNLKAKGLKLGRIYKIRKKVFNFKEKYKIENQILSVLKENKIKIICLAGFMKILSKNFILKFKGKILNIHPSLLPKYGGKGFYGIKVHEQVINAKERHSGATVHFVDEIYDNGPIIAQHRVHVSDDETAKSLSKKVLEIEHKLFPFVVKKICENKVKFINGKPLIQEN